MEEDSEEEEPFDEIIDELDLDEWFFCFYFISNFILLLSLLIS